MGADGFEDVIGVIQYDFVLETEHGDGLGFQIGVAAPVAGDGVGSLVDGSVALYSQVGLGAEEVADIRPHLMLSAELRAAQLPIA